MFEVIDPGKPVALVEVIDEGSIELGLVQVLVEDWIPVIGEGIFESSFVTSGFVNQVFFDFQCREKVNPVAVRDFVPEGFEELLRILDFEMVLFRVGYLGIEDKGFVSQANDGIKGNGLLFHNV